MTSGTATAITTATQHSPGQSNGTSPSSVGWVANATTGIAMTPIAPATSQGLGRTGATSLS